MCQIVCAISSAIDSASPVLNVAVQALMRMTGHHCSTLLASLASPTVSLDSLF
jgi:hypothetical protein